MQLHRKAYIFRVHRCTKLPRPQPLQQYTNRKFRGLVTSLEEEQAPRVIAQQFDIVPWLGDVIPTVAVRLPAPFCRLIVEGKWKHFVLPQCPVGHHGGSASLQFNWGMLGIPFADVPLPPPSGAPDVEESEIDLDRDMMFQITNHLRVYAAELDLEDEFSLPLYFDLENCVVHLQTLYEQLDPVAFAKGIQDLRGHAQPALRAGRSRQYRVAYLLKVVILCDLLRSDADLSRVLTNCARMLLPKSLTSSFKQLLDVGASMAPHKGTVSRWRLLVDGAFMLFYRRLHDRARGNSDNSFARYMMADSSTQHGRDFEHVSVRSIKRSDMQEAMAYSADLVALWPAQLITNFKTIGI